MKARTTVVERYGLLRYRSGQQAVTELITADICHWAPDRGQR